jgi:hypothetical protein
MIISDVGKIAIIPFIAIITAIVDKATPQRNRSLDSASLGIL